MLLAIFLLVFIGPEQALRAFFRECYKSHSVNTCISLQSVNLSGNFEFLQLFKFHNNPSTATPKKLPSFPHVLKNFNSIRASLAHDLNAS